VPLDKRTSDVIISGRRAQACSIASAWVEAKAKEVAPSSVRTL